MRGNLIGLAAFDFILRRLGSRMMGVALVVEITRMHADDLPADAPGFRIPADAIANSESFSHRVHLVVHDLKRASAALMAASHFDSVWLARRGCSYGQRPGSSADAA
jgi:hypothetical protein